MPPPPPAPFIVNVNVVTPAGTVRVCVPEVANVTDAVVVPWNEDPALLFQLLPEIEVTVYVYTVPEARPVSEHEVVAIMPWQPLPLGTAAPLRVTV
jgi:hypothetical protein